MLTHSHLCLSSLSCSLAHSHPLSHTHTHTIPTTITTPTSMHSLKLCLIASHHSQQHSAHPPRLSPSHMHAHAHMHREKHTSPQPCCFIIHLPHMCINMRQSAFFSCHLLITLHLFWSCWGFFSLREPFDLKNKIINVTYCMDGNSGLQNRTSTPWWYFKGRPFLVLL